MLLLRLRQCLLLPCLLWALSACQPTIPPAQAEAAPLQLGAEQSGLYLPIVQGKKVGLLVNQTSLVGEQHLVDVLLAEGVSIVTIFAPEHGFRGDHDAGAKVDHSVDQRTGLLISSMYGSNRKPSAELMRELDLVIFDIQDVGVRYYTYISSMHYLMEVAAAEGTEVLILDRPNPNGRYVDGPVLDLAFQSFVGMHPIPLLHGMTVGELALMIQGEGWIPNAEALQLTVIPMQQYQREQHYSLPVRPSPNLPNDQSIALYASLGFFEATPMSVGRGTPFPFQVLGFDQFGLTEDLSTAFSFTPVSTPGAALTPPLQDKTVYGQDLRQVPAGGLDLSYLLSWQRRFAEQGLPLFNSPGFMDRLAGTDQLRLQLQAGASEAEIRASWQPGLEAFLQQRQPYLLYP
ncbi:exo-beta-N-acetylmuramidase NamZ family protein [Alkalimonas amylolytica]|uniref:Uncharacterized conserved protein YbbC, DUF1343 family n=1 Tax=Alkalimonas amylolytica TaxID=152573 RepID=A0A1H4CKY2_ALKAM|nr:DUF1343 domain-containing protein [Alkalimonas amylolytica]SEA61095.1 Uncharacterized conserved protein YbbC, DUF1343 family [Alkalimonas amylolytica]